MTNTADGMSCTEGLSFTFTVVLFRMPPFKSTIAAPVNCQCYYNEVEAIGYVMFCDRMRMYDDCVVVYGDCLVVYGGRIGVFGDCMRVLGDCIEVFGDRMRMYDDCVGVR